MIINQQEWSIFRVISTLNMKLTANGDKNKTLSIEDYHNKTRPYVKDIINDLKKSKCSLKVMMRTVRYIQKVIT